jgi:glycerol-3-phosphate dehydrogenase (NAD+)
VVKTVEDADLLLFVIPHQFILRTCKSLVGKIKPTATALSLVKGLNNPEPGKIGLISDVIKETLGIEVGVLMGANVANEVASGEYCETTIGNSRRYTARYAVVLLPTCDLQLSEIEKKDASTRTLFKPTTSEWPSLKTLPLPNYLEL